jgi:hypothetical protein
MSMAWRPEWSVRRLARLEPIKDEGTAQVQFTVYSLLHVSHPKVPNGSEYLNIAESLTLHVV